MKRAFLVMLMAGSCCAAFAQVDTMQRSMNGTGNNMGTGSNTGMGSNMSMNETDSLSTSQDYNAYNSYTAVAPVYLMGYVQRDYPSAADIRWRQESDWWHGYYMNGAQPMHIYYNNAGQSFTASLPIKQGWVEESALASAINAYGPMVYDVNTIRGANGQKLYHVRMIENGTVSSQFLNEDGTRSIDVWRMDNADPSLHQNRNMQSDSMNNGNSSMNMNQNSSEGGMSNWNSGTKEDTKLKVKTETADGREQKLKIKNGKMKTKTDD